MKEGKLKRGDFWALLGALARGPPDLPDDWNDGTLKFSLAALADVPYPLIFFCLRRHFPFLLRKKGFVE